MKRPIREFWLFKLPSEGIYALARTSAGIWNLLFHAKPLVLTITWKDLRWALVFIAIWWFVEREAPQPRPALSRFDREFLATRDADLPMMVREHLPKEGGFEAAKTKLEDLGFEPRRIRPGHVYTAGTHPDSVYEWALPRLKGYMDEHDAISVHAFYRNMPRNRGAAYLTFAVRDDGTYAIITGHGHGRQFWRLPR